MKTNSVLKCFYKDRELVGFKFFFDDEGTLFVSEWKIITFKPNDIFGSMYWHVLFNERLDRDEPKNWTELVLLFMQIIDRFDEGGYESFC